MASSNEHVFLEKLGLQIKSIRNEKHMSLNQLANQFGFEKASISRLEGGKTNATVLTLLRLSEALEVPLDTFFKVEHPHHLEVVGKTMSKV